MMVATADESEEAFGRRSTIKQSGEEKILTPVVWCILVTETGERFAYFGFRAILTLYFAHELNYSDSQAIAFFSYTTCLAYLSPLAGALVADGSIGRYRTILYFGLVYILGLWLLTLAAALNHDKNASGAEETLATRRFLSFLGLFLTCTGTGGIKPCVSAFGADQVSMRNSNTGKHESDEDEADDNEGDGIIRKNKESSDARARAEQVRQFFAYFYFCINVGALASMFAVPIVKQQYGFGAAFFLATCFMMTAMVLFWSKRDHYIDNKDPSSSLTTTFRLSWWLMRRDCYQNYGWVQRFFPWINPGSLYSFTDSAIHSNGRKREYEKTTDGSNIHHKLVPSQEPQVQEDNENDDPGTNHSGTTLTSHDAQHHNSHDQFNEQLSDAAQALHVLPILAMFPIFWCLYDQQGSVWTLQATRMRMPSFVQPEQLQVINPLEIMVFIPLFDRIIYPYLMKIGCDIAPLSRMGWGMLLAALSFVISGWVEQCLQDRLDGGQQPISVAWQLPQITFLSIAEIFISVTGLEFAYASSPPRLKAFVMALFLLTTALGDFLSGILYSTVFARMESRAHIMYACALLMVMNWAVFRCVAARWLASSPSPVLRSSNMDTNRLRDAQGLELRELN